MTLLEKLIEIPLIAMIISIPITLVTDLWLHIIWIKKCKPDIAFLYLFITMHRKKKSELLKYANVHPLEMRYIEKLLTIRKLSAVIGAAALATLFIIVAINKKNNILPFVDG